MPHPRYRMAESKIHKSQACGFYRYMYQCFIAIVLGGEYSAAEAITAETLKEYFKTAGL